jgi:hypothetical protein
MPDKDPDIRTAILKAIKTIRTWTIVLFAALCVVTAGGLWEAYNHRANLENVAEQTISALCTFRSDLERRVETSVQFLKDNPDGIPGLSAEAIQTSINNQQRTVDALADLPCEGVPVEVPE